MTQKQQRFVERYLVHLNASKAALEAGFSKRQTGSQLMNDPKYSEVAEAIKRGLRDKSAHDENLRFLCKKTLAMVLQTTPADFFHADGTPKPLSEVSEDSLLALQSWNHHETDGSKAKTVSIRLHNKSAAAQLLAKLIGAYDKIDQKEAENRETRDAARRISGRLSELSEHRRKKQLAQSV